MFREKKFLKEQIEVLESGMNAVPIDSEEWRKMYDSFKDILKTEDEKKRAWCKVVLEGFGCIAVPWAIANMAYHFEKDEQVLPNRGILRIGTQLMNKLTIR